MSANTVERHIENTGEDLKKQVLEQIMQRRRFALWFDQSTDASNMSQFTVFARFCFNDEMHEELLLHEPLKERCTREDIFLMVTTLIKKKKMFYGKALQALMEWLL